MNLGETLIKLRKEKGLSQEEVSDKLNVSRQTISKWETNQSTPDFDKIKPICDLYEITPNELINGEKKVISNKKNNNKKAIGISVSVFLYFISVIWIMISEDLLKLHDVISVSVFMFICAVATGIIIYTCMVYNNKEKQVKEKKNKKIKQVEDILSILFVIIYLLISFMTNAWHITWIIWLIYVLVVQIVKLVFSLRGEDDE